MAPEILGEGVLLVSVKQDVDREMKEAEAAFERSRRRMDRKRATMELDANLAPLQKKVDQAEKKIEEYKRKVADDANLGLDTSKAERNLKDWERKLHERRTARDEINLDTEKARRQLAALQQLEDDRAENARKLQTSVAKGEKKLADARIAQSKRAAKAIKDAEEQATKARIAEENKRRAAGKKALDAEIRDENRRIRSAVAANAKITADRERAESKIRRETEKTAAASAKALERDRSNISGLLKDYSSLQRRIDGLRRNRKSFTGIALPSRRASLDLDISAAKEKAAELAKRLEAVGVDKKHIIDIEVRERNTGAIHRLVSGLSDASVRLGPFTSSVGGALRALTLLAPVIVSVVGALGALTGAVSAGLIGGVGILASGFAGLLPLLAGTVFAVKPIISEFKLATAAQTKLHKAVLQYGSGSKQAKKAQQELNATLKGMDPAAARAVTAFGRVKTSWNNVTQSVARQQFGRVVGEATKTAEANVKSFGRQTNTTMRTLGDGISDAMAALRTKGAKSGINTVLTNVNNVLPTLISGLGNLAVAFGNVVRSFTRGSALGSALKAFEDWTARVREGTSDTTALNKKVDTLADAFKKTASFVSALSGFIVALFGGGVKPGLGLLQDMTNGLNDLTDQMKGPGKSGLEEFFQNSTDTAKQFFETLKPFLQLFMEWATIMRPVATNLLAIMEPVADFARTVMQWKPLRGVIVGVFTALLAARALSGIRNLAGEVKLLARNLSSLKVPGAVARFFGFGGGKGTPKGTTTKPGTTGGGGRSTGPVAIGGHEAPIQSVRIVGPLPIPVEVVGGIGAGGIGPGGKGKGGGGGPLILPGGGPSDSEIPKTRGRFAKFFEKVFGGIKKIPGMGKALEASTAGLALGSRFGGKLLGPFKKALAPVFERLGPALRPILGRVLGGGLFAGLGKIIGKAVPILGWSWLIHDMLPDSPRKAIDKILGDGLKGIGGAFKSNFDAALKTGGDIWGGFKSGATSAWDFVARKSQEGFDTIKKIVSVPLNFSIGLKDKVKGAASSAVNFLGKQASKGFQISLGLKDNVRNVAAKTFSWVRSQAAKGARFALGLLDHLGGAAKSVMASVAGVARRGAKFLLGLTDRLRGPANSVMGAVSGVARRGAHFVLGITDKLSHAANAVFSQIRGAAAAGANFTIRVGATLVGAAAKLGGKALNLAKSIIPAQGAAPGFGNSEAWIGKAFAQGGDTVWGERMHNRTRAEKVMNALELGTRRRPTPAAQTPSGGVRGQSVSRPTYLVGEENRREYVVSTNPAYKGRNQKIVAMAAKDLGMGVTHAAQGTFGNGSPAPDAGYYANTHINNLSGGKAYTFSSKRTKKRKTAERKRARKGLSPEAINNPWGKHIKGLLDQQSDWEREASIRENAVQEPDDYINETKNPDGTTTYELDDGAIATYKAQIQQVADAYQKLTQITAEIVQSIPKAIASMKAEIKGHNYNIGVLTHEIDREEARLRTKGKGASVEATKNSARARLKKLRPALSEEKKANNAAKSLRDEFAGDTRKEAGFDYREFTATYAGLLAELGDGTGSIQADAAAQLASAQSDGSGGSGGSGGGDAPLAYGAQQLIADTEKMNLLREYGGNAYTTSPSSGQGTSPGGGGYIGNPAGIADPARANNTLSGSTAASAGDGGGATLRSMATSSGAATSIGTDGTATSGGSAATLAPTKSISIVNNFETAPEDPHLWSQGMAFEVNTAL